MAWDVRIFDHLMRFNQSCVRKKYSVDEEIHIHLIHIHLALVSCQCI